MDQGVTRLHGVRLLLAIGILASVYLLIGSILIQFLTRQPTTVPIWSPGAISLAALILFGPRFWPVALLGAVAIILFQGLSPALAFAIAAGDTFAAAVAAIVLFRFTGFRPELDRVRDVMALLVIGGVLGAAVASVLGVTSLWLAGDVGTDEYAHRVLLWWRARFGYTVSLTSFLLLLRTGSPRWSELFSRKEFWSVSWLLFATCYLAFGRGATGEVQLLATHLPLVLVIWAGMRLGTRGAAIITVQALLIAAIATLHGFGPFVSDDLATSISRLFIYNMGIAPVGPLMAAAIAQRDHAEAENQRETAERSSAQRERELLEQRDRILREMHDGLGGQIVSVLSMVRRGKATPDEIAEGLRRALDDMRILIDSLETSGEGLRNLLGKLRARLDPLLRRNEIDIEWQIDPRSPLDALDPEKSLHCLRIIQEAMTNVIQHAGATTVRVVISPGESDLPMVSIEVSDNGVGADPAIPRSGHGTKNMLARAKEIGGEIRFESMNPGRRVHLRVPVSGPLE